MKKRLLILLLGIAALTAALLLLVRPADKTIKFADPGLDAAVRSALGLAEDAPFLAEDLSRLTRLDASGCQIEKLDGIWHLPNLLELDLEDNQVRSLAPLAKLKNLAVLNLRNNGIINLRDADFNSITSLPLRRLSLRHNIRLNQEDKKDRLQDISLLARLTGLEWLELRDNHISDLKALENLTQLKYLDIRENRFTDITSLARLTQLEELNLRDNSIVSLEPLAGLKNLRYLNLHSDSQIISLVPIRHLLELETLIIKGVSIRGEEDVLAELVNLKRLNAASTGISDLEPISKLINLEELDLSGNDQISDFSPLETLPKLNKLITESAPTDPDQ